MSTFYTVIGFWGGIIALLTYMNVRDRSKSRSAVVTNIRRKTYLKNEVRQEYVVIHYRTENGRIGKLRLDAWTFRTLCPRLKVGDQLIKESGRYLPTRDGARSQVQL